MRTKSPMKGMPERGPEKRQPRLPVLATGKRGVSISVPATPPGNSCSDLCTCLDRQIVHLGFVTTKSQIIAQLVASAVSPWLQQVWSSSE
jgi:hypothetical protein